MLLLALVAYHYHGEYQDEKSRADTAENNLAIANATITGLETRQRELAALDTRYTKELADAKTENDRLRRKLSAGGRVRVEGNCPPVSGKAAAGSVGNATAVELSAAAGQNVLDIRAGIISDQAKLKYLQGYVSTSCMVSDENVVTAEQSAEK